MYSVFLVKMSGYSAMIHLTDYKGPVAVDGILKRNRNDNIVVTPECAYECLKKTNHFTNMKFIAKSISSLDEKEWLKYKPFVLEAIDGREQVDEVFNVLMNFAKKGNYLELFIAKHHNEKIYGARDKVLITNNGIFPKDMDKYDMLIVNCDSVIYDEDCCLPKSVIFTKPDMISIRRSNFKKNKSLIFSRNDEKQGGCLLLYECSDLPKVLDTSLFKEVDLSHSDLKDVDNIIFGKKAHVKMIDVKNLPEKLNFSEAENVYLDDCNFSRTKEMIFGKTKKLDLSGAKFLPSRLDFTQCDRLVLDGCDFEGVETIYFKDEENAMLIRDGINFENVDVFVGARKEHFDMNRITNSLLFLPKRNHIWDK